MTDLRTVKTINGMWIVQDRRTGVAYAGPYRTRREALARRDALTTRPEFSPCDARRPGV